ncbi:Kin of IRRE-like protein 1 [Elysia marginata]|uniref:Kin of IRRE-like protein 1 n=1 Tax=Elysia marginata TaxID=1093978 RepID=A0AAV4JCS0_9GAST|nr:Kin of IRRE-like protein 1 [Elysia marginata]
MSSRVECEAIIPNYQQHPSNRLRASQILDVLFVPNITMRTNASTQELREKQAVRFHCTGDSNPRIVTWRWERNDTTIPGATTDTFIIPDISHDFHNNKISCIATNRVGSSRVDRRLDVKYGARIVHITEVVGADLDKPTELKCEAIGNPAPIVTWRRKNKGGRVADSGHRSTTVSVQSVYRIDRVSPHSFGWYVCTATVNNFPPASAEAMLLKNDRPNLRSEKDQMATEGKAARLECLAHSIPKPDRITWYRPGGNRINFATSGRFSEETVHMLYGVKSILHIASAQSEDFGYYNCTMTNCYGTVSEKIQLVEKHVLPITFIIIGVIAGVVVMFVAGLACVLYMRCRNEKHAGSVLGSYTDTDSSSDKTVKKRDKLDSPSTLMGQLRQDYNKEMYRFSADYDDMPYKDFTCVPLQEQPQKANNNGYGYIEPYEAYSDHQIYDGDYVHRGDDLVPERLGYDPLYGSGNYSMSSFRANNYDTSTPPPTMTRLTPLHMSNSKLATDV